ncbi:DNA-binding transcriptional regulator [Aliiglaciecola sp. M165]|uniref:XylR family transcriptional regulator n=1 Tax=Aliiglaciecola sp. M165 TaxID=2593649 RepID=UPI001180CCCA|nr:DNA-binding transcriptional regulator [Aliiglaciecola sp. M165]TRY31772.1 DNA-binding transcriptional regulator [Aliiglaciecola sp. M165]
MHTSRHGISLLFNANKVYDRQVIEGIGRYLQSSKVAWDVYLEEDFLARIERIENWVGDGIIADFDDPSIQRALQHSKLPIVGVGGSYQDQADYPDVPYVATDNLAVIRAAYEHLKQKGLERFAFYGLPQDDYHRWAIEREKAIVQLCDEDGYECFVYRGHHTRPETWQGAMNSLSEWLQSLPSPVGIISVTDARARHLLQACDQIGKLVPEQISIVGIDDDDIARNLSRISLSSVTQGALEMGYQAAKLLHRRLDNPNLKNKIVTVPPVGVIGRQSTDYKALGDPFVAQAIHFISQNACSGIKVQQVLDYVGISRSNLENRFMEECRHSIHHAIHERKLKEACQLLAQGDKPLPKIATLSGYPSLPYMYAVFRKHYNLTPKQYQQQNRSNVL